MDRDKCVEMVERDRDPDLKSGSGFWNNDPS